jgi:hypothetical protein
MALPKTLTTITHNEYLRPPTTITGHKTITDMTTTIHTKATIELDGCAEIESALCRRDADAIWTLARSAHSDDFFFYQIQHHCFNVFAMANTVNTTDADVQTASPASNYHSTVLWPIVLDRRLVEGCSALRPVLSQGSAPRVADSLLGLLETPHGSASVWHQAIGYGTTCWASPVVFRQLLDSMVIGSRGSPAGPSRPDPIGLERYPYGVPDDAPVLYFLLGAICSPDDWPQLVGSDDYRTTVSNLHLQASLRMELVNHLSALQWPVHVGKPALAARAIEAGVQQWLKILAEQYVFTRWDMEYSQEDRIDLLVELNHGSVQGMRIPLRRYQIGMDGIQRLIGLVDHEVGSTVAPVNRQQTRRAASRR